MCVCVCVCVCMLLHTCLPIDTMVVLDVSAIKIVHQKLKEDPSKVFLNISDMHILFKRLKINVNSFLSASSIKIMTHDSVNTASADMRQTSVYFTGTKKTPFSHICSSIVPERKLTSFAVKTYWGRAPPISNLS